MAKPMLLGVADALVITKSGLQIAAGTLSSTSIDMSVDASDLRGGRGNKIIGRLKTNKNVSVTIEDLEQTPEFQALVSGAEIKSGSITAYVMPKEVRYVTSGITLEQTPIETKIPCQILKNGSKVEGTVAGGKLTVTGATEGDVILVGGYTYNATSAKHFKVQAGKFAENVTVVLEEDVYDGETMQIIGRKQTILENCSVDENFSLAGSREIGETTASYTFTALDSGDACATLATVVYLGVEESTCE